MLSKLLSLLAKAAGMAAFLYVLAGWMLFPPSLILGSF